MPSNLAERKTAQIKCTLEPLRNPDGAFNCYELKAGGKPFINFRIAVAEGQRLNIESTYPKSLFEPVANFLELYVSANPSILSSNTFPKEIFIDLRESMSLIDAFSEGLSIHLPPRKIGRGYKDIFDISYPTALTHELIHSTLFAMYNYSHPSTIYTEGITVFYENYMNDNLNELRLRNFRYNPKTINNYKLGFALFSAINETLHGKRLTKDEKFQFICKLTDKIYNPQTRNRYGVFSLRNNQGAINLFDDLGYNKLQSFVLMKRIIEIYNESDFRNNNPAVDTLQLENRQFTLRSLWMKMIGSFLFKNTAKLVR